MRIGIIGGGIIARLVLEHRAELGEVEVAGILGRNEASRGRPLAEAFGVPFVTELDALIALAPDAVVEAASHDAVRQYAPPLLAAGIPVIVLSGGALADDALRDRLERRRTTGGRCSTSPRAASAGWMRSRPRAWRASTRWRSR